MLIAFIKINVNIQKLPPPRTAKKSFFTLESKKICIILWPYKNNLKTMSQPRFQRAKKAHRYL